MTTFLFVFGFDFPAIHYIRLPTIVLDNAKYSIFKLIFFMITTICNLHMLTKTVRLMYINKIKMLRMWTP